MGAWQLAFLQRMTAAALLLLLCSRPSVALPARFSPDDDITLRSSLTLTADSPVSQYKTPTKLTASLSDLDPILHLNFDWNFGDGNNMTDGPTEDKQNVQQHFYANPGVYLVTCTVFNEKKGKVLATASLVVTVEALLGPVRVVSAEPVGRINTPILFMMDPCAGCVNNSYVTYIWNFGVANSSIETTHSYVYYQFQDPGEYIIQGRVRNNISDAVSEDLTLTLEVPLYDLSLLCPATATLGEPITFSAEVLGSDPRQYWFRFTNESTAVEAPTGTLTTSFNETGFYNVNLTVTNAVSMASVIRVIEIRVSSSSPNILAYTLPAAVAGLGLVTVLVLFIPRWYRKRQAFVEKAQFKWAADIEPVSESVPNVRTPLINSPARRSSSIHPVPE